MDKAKIRSKLLEKRDKLSCDKWSEMSKAIERNILKSRLYREADKLLLYADYHGEAGTITLIEEALMAGKEVYLPKVHENFNEAKMDFYKIESTYELVSGYMGIMEPMPGSGKCFEYDSAKGKNLLMLVPGVAFDKNGNRLGYGKGYYDNYLSDKPDIVTVGLCFSFQIADELPVNESDIKLDFVMDENTSYTELDKLKFRK